MKTEDIVKQMLTENTGRHMLDSGGANGHHWQRNQGRDFDNEPETTAEFSIYKDELDICITHSLYHWMIDRLDYDERIDSAFQKFSTRKSQVDSHWPTVVENFIKCFNATSIIGQDPVGENTYNGECLLSQTIQYTQFTIHGCDDYVAIQVHNGADVRGGYTMPRIFSCGEEVFYYTDAHLYAPNTLDPKQTIMPFGTNDNSHSWYTDDGYNFYGDGCEDLKTYKATDDPQLRGQGLIFVEDGNAYSPINGAQLEATT